MMPPPLPPRRPGAPPAADPSAGWKLIGRYALCGEIASGGMATVYFGRLLGASGFTRTVAIKRLHPQYAKDPDFASMFLDEARMAARIRHPNVVQTLDVVQLEGELFLVMDYVPGESLSRLFRQLRTQGRLVPRRVGASIVSGALLGLHAAHEARNEQGQPLGLVHRDVSPQNILVGTDGVPRILDFGVAKAAGRAHTTRDGSMKGKCAYMAPEQVTGLPVSRATDIFAAGVLLWELLTGKRLFQAETDAATLMKVMQAAIPPPSSLVPSLPRAWDAVVARATERSPEHRFATARDMAIAVEGCEGVASTTQVGEWVETLAAGTLGSRAQMLARIETTPLDPAALAAQGSLGVEGAPIATTGEHTRVAATVSAALPPPPGSHKARFGIFAAVAAALVTFGVVWSLGGAHGPRAASTTAPPVQVPTPRPMPASAPPPPTADVAAATAVEALPVATPSARASATVRTPAPAPPRAPAAAPRAASGGTPKPTAPADCDPPYTLDADGHRHYKRQCLQ
jgi:eukaryotic-like serine/threonine-protein kinase